MGRFRAGVAVALVAALVTSGSAASAADRGGPEPPKPVSPASTRTADTPPPDRPPTDAPPSATTVPTTTPDLDPDPPASASAPDAPSPDPGMPRPSTPTPSIGPDPGANTIAAIQATVPDGPQDFAYTLCGPGGCEDFLLDDDTDPALPSERATPALSAGTYTLSQAPQSGYGLAISCDSDATVELAAGRVVIDLADGEVVRCTFTATRSQVEVVVEASEPSGSFPFSLCTEAGSCQEVTIDDNDDPTLPDRALLADLTPGVWTLRQHDVAGWGVTDIDCGGGDVDLLDRSVRLAVPAGRQWSCTFTLKRSLLRIVQDTTPDGPRDFTFTTCTGIGTDHCADTVLDDDADPERAASTSIDGLEPGVPVTVTQLPAEGFGLTDISCNGASTDREAGRITLVPTPGQQVTCTFRNRATSLTIAQDTSPSGPQDFTFTGCSGPNGANGCSTFTLDDDTDPALQDAASFRELTPGVEYSVTQAVPNGFGLTSLSCTKGAVDLASGRIRVVLEPGDAVVCTFTDRPTTLTIVQDTTPTAPQDFAFVGCAGDDGALGCGPFALDDDSDPTLPNRVVHAGIDAGVEYSITQSLPTGYGLTALSCTSGLVDPVLGRARVVLRPGDQVTCTFTNRPTTLTIVQDTTPNHAQDFSFEGCGVASTVAGCTTFSLDDDSNAARPRTLTSPPLAAGAEYRITQAAVAGYGLVGLSCTSGVVDRSARLVRVTLQPGDQVTCTFTNRPTTLTIVQDTAPDGAQDFTFTGCGTTPGAHGCTTFALDDDANATLSDTLVAPVLVGATFRVTQDPVDGYGLTGLSCTNGLTDVVERTVVVTLAPGDQVRCTFVVRPTTLTVALDVRPDDAQDFAFTQCLDGQGGPACTSFVLDDEAGGTTPSSATFSAISGGEYTVATEGADGWYLARDTGLSCSQPGLVDHTSRSVSLSLAPGAQVTCTFTFVRTTLTLRERSTPRAAQDFDYAWCRAGGSPCGAFSLDDDNDPTLPNGVALVLEPGTYSLSQSAPDGWELSSATCTSGEVGVGQDLTVDLGPGEQVECTFTNDAATLTITQATNPEDGTDFTFNVCEADGACTQAVLDDDANGQRAPVAILEPLASGVYTITQEASGVDRLTSIHCTGGQVDLGSRQAVVVVGSGADIACTFTNSVTTLLVDVASGDEPYDHPVTQCGPSGCIGYTLRDTWGSTPTVTGQALPAGTYTVVLGASAPGWGLTGIRCTGDRETTDLVERRATIDLQPGDRITCTFTNTETTIHVQVNAVPGLSTDVPVQLCPPSGAPCTAFALDDDTDPTLRSSRAFRGLLAGRYGLEWELGPWSEVASSSSCGSEGGPSDVTIDLHDGDDLWCTLTVTSPTVELHQAQAGSQHFDYTFCSVATGACSTANLFNTGTANDSVTKAFMGDLAPGDYVVTQSPVAGWTLAAIDCSEPWSVDLVARQVVITVTEETNDHCSFTDVRS